MKKCLFLMLMMVSMSVMGQEHHRVYCELVGTGKLFSTKVNVTVDFGQETSYWRQDADQYLVDEKGNKIKFNSMVDAMNYMGRRGWGFEQAYVVTTNQQNVYHWLLSKEMTNDERIDEGLTTKESYEMQEENANEGEKVDVSESDKSSKKLSRKQRRRAIMNEIYQ